MTPLFKTGLLNQPFEDPALLVRLSGERRSLLFDLGDISSCSPGQLMRISDVFVTHTHIDHFIGFDHLLRLNLARDKTITICGPPGLIRNIRGKLQGYTWNLVDGYPFAVTAKEVHARTTRQVGFAAGERFRSTAVETKAFDGTVQAQPHYAVRALRLDHSIFSLAYCLEERFHININKAALDRMGLPAGPWLRTLKDMLWQGAPDELQIAVPDAGGGPHPRTGYSIGRLKESVVTFSKGQKIVYVADCRGTAENIERIISFAERADILYCEAAFLDRDREKALRRGHLTAAQAGRIARDAGVRDLRVFHFSPRYEGRAEELYREAESAFRARV